MGSRPLESCTSNNRLHFVLQRRHRIVIVAIIAIFALVALGIALALGVASFIVVDEGSGYSDIDMLLRAMRMRRMARLRLSGEYFKS
jgi:hypothetical protein